MARAVALACVGVAALAVAQDPMPMMVQAMRNQVAQIAAQFPANTVCPSGCLVSSISPTGNFRTARHDPNTIAQLGAAWSLPDNVVARLQTVMFAQSVTFETFYVSINAASGQGLLTEYVGAARNHNGVAQIALANVHATAALAQQYDAIPVKHCKRRLGIIKSCSTSIHYQPRGFSGEELQRIELAMRAASYQKLSEVIAAAPISFATALMATQMQMQAEQTGAELDNEQSSMAWRRSHLPRPPPPHATGFADVESATVADSITEAALPRPAGGPHRIAPPGVPTLSLIRESADDVQDFPAEAEEAQGEALDVATAAQDIAAAAKSVADAASVGTTSSAKRARGGNGAQQGQSEPAKQVLGMSPVAGAVVIGCAMATLLMGGALVAARIAARQMKKKRAALLGAEVTAASEEQEERA